MLYIAQIEHDTGDEAWETELRIVCDSDDEATDEMCKLWLGRDDNYSKYASATNYTLRCVETGRIIDCM